MNLSLTLTPCLNNFTQNALTHLSLTQFDADGSGSIDAGEFQQLAYACGETLDAEVVGAIVTGLDKDGNGTIDIDEFRTWLNGFDGSDSE